MMRDHNISSYPNWFKWLKGIRATDETKFLMGITVIFFVLSILAIVVAGLLLPRWYCEDIASGIGDRMGGFTAPFIGLLNALLVYIAFRQQKQVNDEIRREMKDQNKELKKDGFFQDIRRQISDLKSNIESIHFKVAESEYIGSQFFFRIASFKHTLRTGDAAIHDPSRDFDLSYAQSTIYFTLFSFEVIIESIERFDLSPDEKRYWMFQIAQLYQSSGLLNIHKVTGDCSFNICSEKHGVLAVPVYRKFLSVDRRLSDFSLIRINL